MIVLPPQGGKRAADARGLREVMLAKIGKLPRSAAQIFEDVREHWGTVDERRLWRTLTTLIESGRVQRIGAPHRGATYVRTGCRVEVIPMSSLPRYVTPLELGATAEDAPAIIVEVTQQLEIRVYPRGCVDAPPLLTPITACQLGQALQEASAWAGQRRAYRRT